MERSEASKIFNAECSLFLCTPESGGPQHLRAIQVFTWTGRSMTICSMCFHRHLHFLLVLQWCFPGWFSLPSLVSVGSSDHSPEPFTGISRQLCYPSMACVKASFWQKHRSCWFLPLFLGLVRSSWIWFNDSVHWSMLMSEVSLDVACICQNTFLLLRSSHGRVCRSWL